MVSYGIGILYGILAGLSNYGGQVLQKKAINDAPGEVNEETLMKTVTRSPLWITGILLVVAVSSIFIFLGQDAVGAALMPGLTASGFLVLAIGAATILKEKLQIKEYLAMAMLVIAITSIGLSNLAIEGSLETLQDPAFLLRLALFTGAAGALWVGFYASGKKLEKRKTLFLALGAGFPFVIANVWMQPLILTLLAVFSGTAGMVEWVIFILGAFLSSIVSFLGLAHLTHAFNSGNASIVVPVQQLPQQVAPVVIYFGLYQLQAPSVASLYLLLAGIVMILVSGFILSKRQAQLERITGEIEEIPSNGISAINI